MGMHAGNVAEVINRNLLVSAALGMGYVAFLPVYDPGIDMILYRESDGRLLKVQIKSRWTIDRKYLGRDLWIAFPANGEWYLAPHDEMVTRAPGAVPQTKSWAAGSYHSADPSLATLAELAEFRLSAIAEPLNAIGNATVLAGRGDAQSAAFQQIGVVRNEIRETQGDFSIKEILDMRDEGRRV